jgi:hypothetical protein
MLGDIVVPLCDALFCAPGNRSPTRPPASTSRPAIPTASSSCARKRRSISSWSTPRGRWWLVDRLESAGIAASGERPPPRHSRARIHQGSLRQIQHPDRDQRFTDAPPPRITSKSARGRSWSRPTGLPPARASPSPRRCAEAIAAIDAALDGGAEIRLGRRRGGDRTLPRRRGGRASFALVDGA